MSLIHSFRSLLSRGLWKSLRGIAPARLRLPLRYATSAIGDREPELRYLDRLGPNRGTAIDVGANEGMFSFRLAKLYDQVHAFEINPSITSLLRAYRHPKIELHEVGLSDQATSTTLYVPIVRGRMLDGWASLHRDNCANAERLVEQTVPVRPLDDFHFENVRFIKSDIEGHELPFLQGAERTLMRNRPNVLIEIKAPNLTDVRRFFEKLNYREHPIESLIGIAGSDENHLFLPCDA